MRHLVSFFMPSRALSHILRDGVARVSVISSELPSVISSERSESRNLLFGHARPDRASLAASFVILSEAKNLPAASVIPDLIGNLALVISSERSESRNLLLLGNQTIKSINL